MASNRVYFADNLPVLQSLPAGSVDLIYIDPPFNTGKTQARTQIKTVRVADGEPLGRSTEAEDSKGRSTDPGRVRGDRIGFAGRRYETVKIGQKSYADLFDDYLAFLEPRLVEAYRVLKPHGSLYFHIDYREVHYCKVLLDCIFGRESFLNEIIWAYDYGARTKKKWPPKHDNILWYARDPRHYTFNVEAIDRIPYMAPGLVGPEKAARGKLPTDTWWATIVATNSKEKTGYPTQKPVSILNRIILASSNPDDVVLDFFAGSGSVGEVCLKHSRSFILVDNNPVAIDVMRRRFDGVENIEWITPEER